MSKSFSFFFLLSSFFLLLSPNALAVDQKTVFCNSCTASGYVTKAKLSVHRSFTSGTFDRHVADLNNRKLVRFSVVVTTYYEGLDKIRLVTATSKTPDPQVQSIFNQTLIQHDLYQQSKTSPITLPGGFPVTSAFGLAQNGYAQSQVVQYFHDTSAWYDVVSHYALLVAQLAGDLLDVNVVFTVVFPDGSTSAFKINGIDENSKVTIAYLDGSARDRDGNYIPASPEEFDGYQATITSSDSLADWLSYAASMGIPITGSGGGTIAMSCRMVDNAVICKLKRK